MINKPPLLPFAALFAALVLGCMLWFGPLDWWLAVSNARFQPAPTVHAAVINSMFLNAETAHLIWGVRTPTPSVIVVRDSTVTSVGRGEDRDETEVLECPSA